ncbi:pyridoxamine 5'-phosphate oxidase family protein [Marinobacterium arenosum]|uniref:pyridoxamine 5'-phosphate oxidase family protein n=1 Tax=Marinobacterium arenosum TaxID=2862496 RepID=UPI001C93F064|nr:pyridoxamine 5'-phosphate oxidase family protein [Marinobacterium arenosum]MBY4677421.1 pyridoxamine 5'-phosphate oxidase family protein [Marinobacterium arenosum]
MKPISVTEQTQVKRGPKKACYDRETIYRIYDDTYLCHIGATIHGQAVVQPNLHWRIGDELLVHGSAKNALFQSILQGEKACITVSTLDGLVFARSAFHHSVNFRSVMLYGQGRLIEDEQEKRAALDALLERYSPGRSGEARPPNDTELKATSVFAFPIEEVSAKIRTGGPVDDPADMALDVWAGVRPVETRVGELIVD